MNYSNYNGPVKIIKKPYNLQIKKDYIKWKKTDNFKRWKNRQFLKQGGLCYYCGINLSIVRINVEHKTAISLGGLNNKSNLVLACSNCNKEKGSKILSKKDRARLRKINNKRKGTYVKNKKYFNNQYSEFTDVGILNKLSKL